MRVLAMAARRAVRVGVRKPWSILAAPPARDWCELLAELPPDLGLELCMLVRQVRLAAGCSPALRSRLFAARPAPHVHARRRFALSAAPPRLRGDLRRLMRIAGRRPPPEQESAAACGAVAAWAEDAGHPRTALHFAEAGAAILPGDGRAAFAAGRMNHLLGDAWRAEVFYARAVRLAHREQRWGVFARAHLGLGRVLAAQGRTTPALRHYRTAARAAHDQGAAGLAAETYHDLLLLHSERGDWGRAMHFALRALRTYPRPHARFAVAVHDVAALLVLRDHIPEAMPLLRGLCRARLPPEDRVLVCGTLARAAGAVGAADAFAEAESRVLQDAPRCPGRAAGAFVDLAFGARALGRWELAEAYAVGGIEAAEEHGEVRVASVGRALLEEVRARKGSGTVSSPAEEEAAVARLRGLGAELEARLGRGREESATAEENPEEA